MQPASAIDWSGRKVIVTGAGGFIGSHLAEQLVQSGASTVSFVRYDSAGSYGWLDRSPYLSEMRVIAGDITDSDTVSAALVGIDTIFHLAALIGIPYSYAAPASYIRVNIEGTLNILQSARRHGARRIVHTSTSEVYGTARYVPIDELHPLQGQSPYSASKIGADKIAESFFLSFGTPLVTVRPFNTFGPRQSARAIVPTIITQMLAGETIRLGNVRPTRDLNYVSNTVDGFLLAAGAQSASGEAINLGSGRETSVGNLAVLIGRIAGRPVHIETDAARDRPEKSEVERLVADNTKARTLLGWQPSVTLEDGLARTIAWIADNFDRYRPGVYVV